MTSFLTTHFDVKEPIYKQLLGETPIDPTVIKSQDDYLKISKTRHDLIHAIICDANKWDFGEKSLEFLKLSGQLDIKTDEYYEAVKTQTPDHLEINGRNIILFELTISRAEHADSLKRSKYALLTFVLKSNGYRVRHEITVIKPDYVLMSRNELLKLNLNDVNIELIKDICTNANNLFKEVHRTEIGSLYQFPDKVNEDRDFGVSIDDLDSLFDRSKEKVFHDKKDMFDCIRDRHTPNLTIPENELLDNCVELVEEVISPFEKTDNFSEEKWIEEINSMATKKDVRSIFPLPFLDQLENDSAVRPTISDFEKLTIISSKMIECEDPVLSFIGGAFSDHLGRGQFTNNEEFLFNCRLPKDLEEIVALDGPLRKKYLRMGSPEHIQSATKNKLLSLHLDSPLEELDDVLRYFSIKDRVDEDLNFDKFTTSLSNLSGPGLNYAQVCQSIYREVNINAMRGNRRKMFCLKPTGVTGVFVLLFPGPKLRAGELANIVWFKVIVENSAPSINQKFFHSPMFKSIERHRKIMSSNWISADVHRLDHYIRCYDKILMTYLSYIHNSYKKLRNEDEDHQAENLTDLINNDRSNALGVIIATYLEDRRTTSKVLQHGRYLVMTSLSYFPKYGDVMGKMVEPIRSTLHLYFIRKFLNYYITMKSWKIHENISIGKVQFNKETKVLNDVLAGSIIMLPRLITEGETEKIDFSQLLNEMYFTMLFNKNQDDPTHSSFQILDKIIEMEDNYNEVKSSGDHLGYRSDESDLEFSLRIIKNPKVHQFSRLAMRTGAKLFYTSIGDDYGEKVINCTNKKNINKTLDEFATYKSSATHISDTFTLSDKILNPRTKCIKGVIDLVNEGHKNSLDVCRSFKNEDTYYQVFKKNQIGGVREILILPITNRVRINVLETISRNICMLDHREMLTHGTIKYDVIKTLLLNCKRYKTARLPIHLTFDKSKWGPSFVPIQFLYMFDHIKDLIPNAYLFIMSILIHHQNKFCLMPERLMRAWAQDPDNKLQHRHSLSLQRYKEKFLKDHDIKLYNHSNMGQGILHYTSSLLHLQMIEFRNELYKRTCKKLGLDHNDHEDILSSDDSYTLLSPEITSEKGSMIPKFKLKVFLRCQYISELLFNCRTSMNKSSINSLIGEFNSLFFSNMNMIPTLMKFAVSSTHPQNTDSFYNMVKNGYATTRMIIENGGSLAIYHVANKLNAKYAESIYHTREGKNAPTIINIENLPFQHGIYPIFDPSLMLLLGPEFHNYKIFKRLGSLTQLEKNIWNNSHRAMNDNISEIFADSTEVDYHLNGLVRIEAAVGPIRQLITLKIYAKEKLGISKEELDQKLISDPIFFFKRDSEDITDIKYKIVQKLYTKGAKEAVKTITSSIYYGRVSATVSANAFRLDNSEESKTYYECLSSLCSESKDMTSEMIKLFYPRWRDYDYFHELKEEPQVRYKRDLLEPQNLVKLATQRYYTRLTQPIIDLVEYKWFDKPIPESLESKITRDLAIIKNHYPIFKDTFVETKNQFEGDDLHKIKMTILLLLKLYSLRDRYIKGVMFGHSTSDVIQSNVILRERNKYPSETIFENISKQPISLYRVNYDLIFSVYNAIIVCNDSSFKTDSKTNPMDLIDMSQLNYIMMDNSVSWTIRKRLIMLYLTKKKETNVQSISKSLGVYFRHWQEKQRMINGNYVGNFSLLLYSGEKQFTISKRNNDYYMTNYGITDPSELHDVFQEALKHTDTKESDLKLIPGGYIIKDGLLLKSDKGYSISVKHYSEDVPVLFGYLTVDSEWTTLWNQADEKYVMRVQTGLLSTTTPLPNEYNFWINGMLYNSLVVLGAFQSQYNTVYRSKDEALKILLESKFLDVDRPKISSLTIDRLGITWPEDDVNSDEKKEEVNENVGIEFQSTTDFLNQLMAVSDFNLPEDNEDDTMNFLIGAMLDDNILSVESIKVLHTTRVIYSKVKSIKYELIAHQFLRNMRVNKETIKLITSILRPCKESKYIMYSIISVYDKINGDPTIKSPEGTYLDLNTNFDNHWNVTLETDINDLI